MEPADLDDLVREAVRWMLAADSPDLAEPGLYHGRAGVLRALVEARAHLDDAGLDEPIERGADRLAAEVVGLEDASLYFGLAGVAATLHALDRPDDARTALHRVRALQRDDGRWGPMFELLLGNAGIALGAVAADDVELAVAAVEPYAHSWDATPGGVSWPVRPTPPRSHHLAHGTLGIALALASVGAAAGRPDLVELAVRAAEDVVARDEAGPEGFLVPHSDPQHRPDVVERYSLGWCNGPAGDAQVFRRLRDVTGEHRWASLADRCWHTVTTSGLPQRLRPGFWDNQGACCGTAGVLALACDRLVEQDDDPAFADELVADLRARAVRDDDGVRWSNHEHRADPPDLDPRPGWSMGSAGVVRELMRWSRLRSGRDGSYAVDRPDHPPVRPAPQPWTSASEEATR